MLVAHDNGCCTWVFSNLTLTLGSTGARLSPVLTTQAPLTHTPKKGQSTTKSAHVTVILQWASCWLLRDRDEAIAVPTLDLSPGPFWIREEECKGLGVPRMVAKAAWGHPTEVTKGWPFSEEDGS